MDAYLPKSTALGRSSLRSCEGSFAGWPLDDVLLAGVGAGDADLGLLLGLAVGRMRIEVSGLVL